MSKKYPRLFALICIICLLTCMLCSFTTASASQQSLDLTCQNEAVSVTIDGVPVSRAVRINGTTYMALSSFCEAIGLVPVTQWDEQAASYSLWSDGMHMQYVAGERYLQANGRYILLEQDAQKVGENLVFPIRSIARAFHVGVSWVEGPGGASVALDLTSMAPMIPAEAFYDAEDLYWLSRIIHAEAGNQSLDGKIGVGNVVLNRVADPTCPDTVYEVIFDNRYGVQFSPTESGSIYCDPSPESVIAAKLSMEGYETVGASLFFLNPKTGASNWFENTRTFVVTIGNHDFYA